MGLSVFLIVTAAVWLTHNHFLYREKKYNPTENPEAKLITCCDDKDKYHIEAITKDPTIYTEILSLSCCPLFMIEGSSEPKKSFSKATTHGTRCSTSLIPTNTSLCYSGRKISEKIRKTPSYAIAEKYCRELEAQIPSSK